MKLSKFDKAYQLIMEQINEDDLSEAVSLIEREYNRRSLFQEAKQFDPATMDEAYRTTAENTKKAFEDALKSGETIKLFNPYTWASIQAKVINPSEAPGRTGMFYKHHALKPNQYCFLFNPTRANITKVGEYIIESEHERLLSIAKPLADKFAANEAEMKDKIENSPEFAKFKEDLKANGFGSVLGSTLSIGKDVPVEFYPFFSAQSQEIKNLFIMYVRDYPVYPSNLEYYDGSDYYRARDEGDAANRVKSAFLDKLRAC